MSWVHNLLLGFAICWRKTGVSWLRCGPRRLFFCFGHKISSEMNWSNFNLSMFVKFGFQECKYNFKNIAVRYNVIHCVD